MSPDTSLAFQHVLANYETEPLFTLHMTEWGLDCVNEILPAQFEKAIKWLLCLLYFHA